MAVLVAVLVFGVVAVAVALVAGGDDSPDVQEGRSPEPPREDAPGGASTPPRAVASCQPAFGPFKVDNWPSGCWRPYSAASPFNQVIPRNPRVHPDSEKIVKRVLTDFGLPADLEAGKADTPDDFQHPVYYSTARDPAYRITCFEDYGGECELEGRRVRIPRAAKPAGGSDSHLAIVDQGDGWEYDLFEVPKEKPAPGGTLRIGWGGRTRVDGNGLGSDATAAQFGLLAGIIRAQELEGEQINHALFLVLRCDNGEIVFPATGHGRRCSTIDESDENAPPMGARLQLAMSDAEIEALGVPPWKKTVLLAMAHYGLYFGDTGGAGFEVQFESGSTYTSFGREDQMVTFAKTVPSLRVFEGRYIFELAPDVDWRQYLRVLHPCVAQGRC